MDDVAVRVGEDLDFDVARALDSFFEINLRIAESRSRFRLRRLKSRLQLFFRGDESHAFAAAARRGFEHDRITKARSHFERFIQS
jgi:hypothetical protein